MAAVRRVAGMGNAWGFRRFWGLALIVSVALAAGCGKPAGDDASFVADEVGGQHGPGAAGDSGHDGGLLPPQSVCNEMDPPDPDQSCGLTWEEHHQTNTRHLDRYPFDGDPDAADELADEVRQALEPLAAASGTPSVPDVETALSEVAPDARVVDNAARTRGTAFGIGIDGGCVYGSVHEGEIRVEIDGWIRDGGCLASYGH